MSNTRSRRQIDSLRHIRDWHFKSAIRAQTDGRIDEADFHMSYYRLHEAAVAEDCVDSQRSDGGMADYEPAIGLSPAHEGLHKTSLVARPEEGY